MRTPSMVQSRRGRIVVLGFLLTAITVVLLLFWSGRPIENRQSSPNDSAGNTALTPTIAPGGSPRRVAADGTHQQILAVNEAGAPVGGALVRLPSGESVLTDNDGVALFRAETQERLKVEKSGFFAVDVTWGQETTRRVELLRQPALTVQVSDEYGRPLTGVELFAADWWYPDRASLVSSEAPVAMSDSRGYATVILKRFGYHHLHAYHAHWITNSRVSQESMYVNVRGNCTVSVVMAPLQVVAFLPKGIDVLKSELKTRGPLDGSPTNRFDRSVIVAAKSEIEDRYPGSTAFIMARTRLAPPTGDARVECKLLIVPIGRVAQSRTVEMVNLDEFNGPFEFTSDDSPASNAFGTLLVECKGVPPDEVAGWRAQLELVRDPKLDNPALRGYTQRIHFDEVATVPEGKYRMHVPDNALLDMIAVKRGEIVIERGGVTRVSIAYDAPLFAAELTIAMPDGGRCRDFQIHYSSVSIPGTCTEVITSPKRELKRWLPEGSYSWRILMAGPTNNEVFVGSGEFVVTSSGGSVILPVTLQKG